MVKEKKTITNRSNSNSSSSSSNISVPLFLCFFSRTLPADRAFTINTEVLFVYYFFGLVFVFLLLSRFLSFCLLLLLFLLLLLLLLLLFFGLSSFFSPSPSDLPDLLAGLVVKASASGAEDPGFDSRFRRDFSGSCRTSDLKFGTPVASLPGAWCYRVSAGTGRPGVSIL